MIGIKCVITQIPQGLGRAYLCPARLAEVGKCFAIYAKCALPAGFDIEKLHKFVSLDFGLDFLALCVICAWVLACLGVVLRIDFLNLTV